MVAKLGQAERARRELVASVSHDLRTPVTTLRLIAEGLEDGIFEPERTREQLRLVATNVRALGALIDDLFELSRLEAGDIRWSMEQVALDELLARDDRGDAPARRRRPRGRARRARERSSRPHAEIPSSSSACCST